jgi:hypothetical protein
MNSASRRQASPRLVGPAMLTSQSRGIERRNEAAEGPDPRQRAEPLGVAEAPRSWAPMIAPTPGVEVRIPFGSALANSTAMRSSRSLTSSVRCRASLASIDSGVGWESPPGRAAARSRDLRAAPSLNVGEDLFRDPVGVERFQERVADRSRSRSSYHPGDHAEAGMVVDPGHDRHLDPACEHDVSHDAHLASPTSRGKPVSRAIFGLDS